MIVEACTLVFVGKQGGRHWFARPFRTLSFTSTRIQLHIIARSCLQSHTCRRHPISSIKSYTRSLAKARCLRCMCLPSTEPTSRFPPTTTSTTYPRYHRIEAMAPVIKVHCLQLLAHTRATPSTISEKHITPSGLIQPQSNRLIQSRAP